MDRRAFIGSAAAGLALPGCVATPRPTAALGPAGCLPPVDVAAGRVIRTVAGLRPFRASGFVVKAEPLGDKRLVHNYGHGGAGITLSWGSSKLAVELGLQGHRGPAAVLGAGVMGLTTARLVQEAGFRGHDLHRGAPAARPPPTSRAARSRPSAISIPARLRPNGGRSSPPRWTIAGGASRSWSARITESAGFRPTRNPPISRAGRTDSIPTPER